MQVNVVQNKISTINPATGKVVASYNMTQNEQISQIINNARTAFEKWKKKDIPERCAHLSRLAKLLKKNREHTPRLLQKRWVSLSHSHMQKLTSVYGCVNTTRNMQNHFYKIK